MRKSNIELLRIICILMIITLHYLNGSIGGSLTHVIKGSINYYLVHFIESLCIISVNVFILITGYFSYKKTNVKISKPLYLMYVSIFYGIIIFLVVFFIGKVSLNKNTLFIMVLDATNEWFVIAYSVLYLLIPFINKLINNISIKNYRLLIIIGIIFFYIWPTFYTKVLAMDSGYGIINFINLYLIGSFIGKYYDSKKMKIIKTISVYLMCVILTTIFSFFMEKRAFEYNSIFNLIGAISLFLTFKMINMKNSKVINYLSSYTFSTYIIHVNSFLGVILFHNIFKCNMYYESKLLIVNLVISVIGIYLLCIAIEFIRRLLMKKLVDNKIEKIKYSIDV